MKLKKIVRKLSKQNTYYKSIGKIATNNEIKTVDKKKRSCFKVLLIKYRSSCVSHDYSH